MAKRRGVRGWHSMRKDQLIRALVRASKTKKAGSSERPTSKCGKNGKKKTASPRRATASKSVAATSRSKSATTKSKRIAKPKNRKAKSPTVDRRIRHAQVERNRMKDLTTEQQNGKGKKQNSPVKDRIALLVRDAYWLHAYWQLTHASIVRAQAALGGHWFTAKPVLRLLAVGGGNTTNTSERVVRDIEIHGGVNNWYVDVKDSPKNYRVAIGYLSSNGRFHSLARSNKVTTPRPGSSDVLDQNWSEVAENCEKIYAMSGGDSAGSELRELFEEQLRRPMGEPMATQYGDGAGRMVRKQNDFEFEVDAEMIVYGVTKPDSYVTLAGEPVKLRNDGTFTVRLSLPDRRQILPVVAQSSDGIQQRTTVLSINRNTKVMEPVIRDPSE